MALRSIQTTSVSLLIALISTGCGGFVPGPCGLRLDRESNEVALDEARSILVFFGAITEEDLVEDMRTYDEVVNFFCHRVRESVCEPCRTSIAHSVFSEIQGSER